MPTLFRTFPGELARQIIVGMDSSRSNDPSSHPCCPAILSGGDHEDVVRRTGSQSNAPTKKEESTSRTIRIEKRRKRRKRARLSNGVMPLRDHPSRYQASHSQIGNLIAKCLPQHCITLFLQSFQISLRKYKKNNIDVSTPPPHPVPPPTDPKVIKTPVQVITEALHKVFGIEYVSVVACNSPATIFQSDEGMSYADLEFVLLDCILARKRRIDTSHNVKRKSARKLVDTPVKMLKCKQLTNCGVSNDVDQGYEDDECYRACIVIIKDAGVFYCHRQRRHESAGKQGTHVPMDINWLRLSQRKVEGSSPNWFGSGSYALRMSVDSHAKAFKFCIRRSAHNFQPGRYRIKQLKEREFPLQVFQCYQCTDEDGPCLPPDFIDGEDSDLSLEDRCTLYRKRYQESPSAKRGCRHYVRGMLYKNIDPVVTWVIDPSKGSPEVDLQIIVHVEAPNSRKTGRAGLLRSSVLKIRYLPQVVGIDGSAQLLNDIHEHCIQVKNGKRGGARAGKGDYGKMYPIGCHIEGVAMKRYAASSELSDILKLRKAVTAAYKLSSVTVPAVVRVIQDLEDDAEVPRLAGMDGEKSIPKWVDGKRTAIRSCNLGHTMDLSVNLANASHFDVNDASQGFSIWTEDFPGGTKMWMFVLPNLRGNFPDSDREYRGVAIKLTHGVLISWDGRVVRHCTSFHEAKGDVCGTFFAAKTKVVRHGMREAHERISSRRAANEEEVVRAWQQAFRDHHEGLNGQDHVALKHDDDESAMLDSPPDVPVDDDGNVSVSSAIDLSEDEDENATDDDSSDGGVSISSETERLMGRAPFEGIE